MSSPSAKETKSGDPSKGLEGVVAGQTVLSLVDGENSSLSYLGIPVHELAENSTFEEVAFLLWNRRFPKQAELNEFKTKLASERELRPELIQLIKSFPATAHPMAVLRTFVSSLALYDKEERNASFESNYLKALQLTAKIPTAIAAFHRFRLGKSVVAPDKSLSHAGNFLFMMSGEKPAAEMERALDAYLVLLADHGFNASTFSARVTVSTQSDMYSAISSAVGTLKGDLHGSANQHAMEMILDIGVPEKAESYVRDLLVHKKKVMGFGHRIYKKEDPRARAFRSIADKLCTRVGERKWMDISNRIEKVMMDEKKIPCNVDFFSASVLYILGFPVDFFTTVFAASRISGWTAHVMEQLSDNRLIRPAADYVGLKEQHYIPMKDRQ